MPPVWFVLVCLATVPGAILFPNVTGIIFDLYMPKIKWDNEQKAVKQNMNVLYGMLTASAMVAVVAIIVVKFSLTLVPAVAVIVLVPLVLTLASATFISKNSGRILRQLTP
jgi:ABC-2 type transport system permease protein